MITTTLKEIRAKDPCADGFTKIRDHLGVSAPDAKSHDDPFPVALLLETNDLDDTLWVFDRCVNPRIRRLFAADCAEHVLPLFEQMHPDDSRPRRAIDCARGPHATDEDRAAARDAARAARAARAAAGDAAWAAINARLRQYLEHGESAKDMPWESPVLFDREGRSND